VVVRLALAEATVPQIATFTGHSLKDVEAILHAHCLGRDIIAGGGSNPEARKDNKAAKTTAGSRLD
jgi:hypothetical protein